MYCVNQSLHLDTQFKWLLFVGGDFRFKTSLLFKMITMAQLNMRRYARRHASNILFTADLIKTVILMFMY